MKPFVDGKKAVGMAAGNAAMRAPRAATPARAASSGVFHPAAPARSAPAANVAVRQPLRTAPPPAAAAANAAAKPGKSGISLLDDPTGILPGFHQVLPNEWAAPSKFTNEDGTPMFPGATPPSSSTPPPAAAAPDPWAPDPNHPGYLNNGNVDIHYLQNQGGGGGGGDAGGGGGGDAGGGGGGDVDWGDDGGDGGGDDGGDVPELQPGVDFPAEPDTAPPDDADADDAEDVTMVGHWLRGCDVLGADTIPSVAVYSDHDTVLAVQTALKDKGFDPGPLDGVYGPKTKKAIEKMQDAAGLPRTGVVDYGVLMALKVTASAAPGASSSPRSAGGSIFAPVPAPSASPAAPGQAPSGWQKPMWPGAPFRVWQGVVGGAGLTAIGIGILLAVRRR